MLRLLRLLCGCCCGGSAAVDVAAVATAGARGGAWCTPTKWTAGNALKQSWQSCHGPSFGHLLEMALPHRLPGEYLYHARHSLHPLHPVHSQPDIAFAADALGDRSALGHRISPGTCASRMVDFSCSSFSIFIMVSYQVLLLTC